MELLKLSLVDILHLRHLVPKHKNTEGSEDREHSAHKGDSDAAISGRGSQCVAEAREWGAWEWSVTVTCIRLPVSFSKLKIGKPLNSPGRS